MLPRPTDGVTIAENLERVREQVARSVQSAGRSPGDVRLVAVSKTVPPDAILEAYRAGIHEFGENRVEEASEKIPELRKQVGESTSGPNVRWHLVGHLQRRKARDAIALFDVIQSVDTVRLAETLSRQANAHGKNIPVLLQVNVGRDPQKSGFAAEPRDAFLREVETVLALPGVQVEGLMTIGPLVTDAEQGRPTFRALCLLREFLAARYEPSDWRELSMGMSEDFPVAIAEGATIIRIGRAIFGERPH